MYFNFQTFKLCFNCHMFHQKCCWTEQEASSCSIDPPIHCAVSSLQAPWGRWERRSFLASTRRLCPPPVQAEAPAGGLRPADTRRYLGGEAECNVPVRSTSLPPFLWVNKKLWLLLPHLTHSHTHTHRRTHHPRNTCTLSINSYSHKNHTDPHTCTETSHAYPWVQDPDCYGSLSSFSPLYSSPSLHFFSCFGSLWGSFVSSRLSNVYLFTVV